MDCCLHTYTNSSKKYDPTESLTLRNTFSSNMSSRLSNIRGVIRQSIVENDCFGLSNDAIITQQEGIRPIDWKDLSEGDLAEQVSKFLYWLRNQLNIGIVNVSAIESSDRSWLARYNTEAYKKGIAKARKELRKKDYRIPDLEDTGGIEISLRQPAHNNSLNQLKQKTINEVEKIKSDLLNYVDIVLAHSLREGYNKFDVALRINKGVIKGNDREKLGTTLLLGNFVAPTTRFDIITSDSIVRAINEAALNEYANWGLTEVGIMVEWVTAGDDRVCPYCHQMALSGPYKIEEAKGLLPAHPRCYDSKTEVLTNEGWKLFKDLKGYEEIFSMNPDTHEVDWLPYNKKVQYYYEGTMKHISSPSYDLLVTPDHQVFFGTRPDPKNRTIFKWKMDSIKNIENKGEFYLPKKGKWYGKEQSIIDINGLKFYTDDFVKFMGYYLSEGSVTKRSENWYQISIHQDQPNKDIMYNSFFDLPVKVNNKSKQKIYINSKSLGSYLMGFGKSADKFVPKEIKNLPSDKIKIFLEAYLFGDGTRRKPGNRLLGQKNDSKEVWVFTTSSKNMAADLGELIIKAGGSPSYAIKRVEGKLQKFNNGTYRINNDQISITWLTSSTVTYSKNSGVGLKIEDKEYKGMVYDVELPKWHVLFVRRNGRTAWSGNCRCFFLPA